MKTPRIITKHYLEHPYLSHTIIPIGDSNVPTGIIDPAEFIEPNNKVCDFCDGTGKVKENDYEDTLHKCEDCHGTGEEPMSDEECFMDEVERRNNEKENQNRHDL